MSRSTLLLPTALLSGALSLGCADSQSPSVAPANPATAALRVERGTQPFGFAFADDRYILFLGLTVEDLTGILCTGAEFDVDEVEELTVVRPSDGSLKALQRGEVNVAVAELSTLDDFCDRPLDVVLTGTATVLYTDSDVFVSGNRADASQIQVIGTVTGPTGILYRLHAINVRVIAPGSTADDPTNLNALASIQLTPAGR